MAFLNRVGGRVGAVQVVGEPGRVHAVRLYRGRGQARFARVDRHRDRVADLARARCRREGNRGDGRLGGVDAGALISGGRSREGGVLVAGGVLEHDAHRDLGVLRPVRVRGVDGVDDRVGVARAGGEAGRRFPVDGDRARRQARLAGVDRHDDLLTGAAPARGGAERYRRDRGRDRIVENGLGVRRRLGAGARIVQGIVDADEDFPRTRSRALQFIFKITFKIDVFREGRGAHGFDDIHSGDRASDGTVARVHVDDDRVRIERVAGSERIVGGVPVDAHG